MLTESAGLVLSTCPFGSHLVKYNFVVTFFDLFQGRFAAKCNCAFDFFASIALLLPTDDLF
jgi:hypothetical protein